MGTIEKLEHSVSLVCYAYNEEDLIAEFFKKPVGYVPGLNNSIMPWKIAKDGKVTNGLA